MSNGVVHFAILRSQGILTSTGPKNCLVWPFSQNSWPTASDWMFSLCLGHENAKKRNQNFVF